jgi:hypothetical protein
LASLYVALAMAVVVLPNSRGAPHVVTAHSSGTPNLAALERVVEREAGLSDRLDEIIVCIETTGSRSCVHHHDR